MELFLVLLLIGIGFGVRGLADNVRNDSRASRDAKLKAASKAAGGKLPKHERSVVARRATAGWWAREAAGGFPAARTGWHAGWIAHKTALARQRVLREEARTEHAETQAGFRKDLAAHRERQAQARKELEAELAAEQAKGSPATGRKAVQKAADEVSRKRKEREQATGARCPGCGAPEGYDHLDGCDPSVPPLPAASVPRDDLAEHLKAPMPDPRLSSAQRQRDQNGRRNLCAACGHPGSPADDLVISDGYRVHQSHTHDPASGFYEGPAPEPSDELPGGPMRERAHDGTHKQASTTASPTTQGAPVTADTNYTTVLTNAKLAADQAEQDAVEAGKRRQVAQQHAEEMQAAEVDPATLSSQMDLVDRLTAAEQAAKETGEHALAVSNGLQQRHGGLHAAHVEAPVRAAQREFYEGD